MDLGWMLQAVSALREARSAADFVLLDPGVVRSLRRVLSAEEISFTDLDLRVLHHAKAPLSVTGASIKADNADNRDFPDILTTCGTDCFLAPSSGGLGPGLVMPLPSPPGRARLLAFSRGADYPFAEKERAVAVLLQPHVTDALRIQSHRTAADLLTQRQYELLRLVATGCDNVEIARHLSLSRTTVRKHLENAFARLGVASRTAAVARLWPDVTWC